MTVCQFFLSFIVIVRDISIQFLCCCKAPCQVCSHQGPVCHNDMPLHRHVPCYIAVSGIIGKNATHHDDMRSCLGGHHVLSSFKFLFLFFINNEWYTAMANFQVENNFLRTTSQRNITPQQSILATHILKGRT